MIESNATKNKHLTLDDRVDIQTGLNQGLTFKTIAKKIGKDQTTVSKEVKKHLTLSKRSVTCRKSDGTSVEEEICPRLLKTPFVCNPCSKRHGYCAYQKRLYHAKAAQEAYESLLSEAREGIPLNKEEFYRIDAIITEGINKGQHLYHILQTYNLGISKSTVYRHLHLGYLSVSPVQFPRVVKFKQRRKPYTTYVPKAVKKGRTHDDFLAFIEEHHITSWVEMDTVIGRIGGKVIMTFDFTFCNFMIGFLLENKTAAQVTEKIQALKRSLVAEGFRFGDLCPLILTDNGGEFSNVFDIENSVTDHQKETNLFFCDPCQSSQKPKVEKNHTLFREIVPKGRSFDSYTQETVNLIFSHVNSVKREIYHGKTSYELFAFVYGEPVAKLLGITPIPGDQVIQSPKLLNRNI